MWLPLTLLVLVGAVTADYDHGWQTGKEYTYLVRSRTFTGLDELSNQYTGILIKALLTVQPQDGQTLRAKVSKAQYANIHKDLPKGWDSKISDQMLELRPLPLSEKPFEIKIKHGIIRDLVVDGEVRTWEVNVLKSIVSQLQVDTQGENAKRTASTQIPEGDEPFAMFKSMEDSVGGKCEVLYDIMPMQESVLINRPELVPMPQLKGDGQFIDIIKSKNFSKCEQRMSYHFGITGKTNWEPGSNDNGKFFSRSSTSRIIISGNLKSFTIQSSVTTSKMIVSPRVFDRQSGVVISRMNLTLAKVEKSSESLPAVNNGESTGNLVYMYNNPFSDSEQRRPGRPSGSPDSRQSMDSGSRSAVSSSEELRRIGDKQQKGRSSSSDSASSSSISSSEEVKFWQPKPTLEDAPENPLLPFFVGYRGKSVGKSDEIDLVKSTKDLVMQIAAELEDPTNIPTEESLEKFTILSSLLRTMSKKQIAEAEGNMHLSQNELKSNEKSQSKRQNAWAVFRDAVTQAGTGPALMIIKEWVETKKIEGLEARDVLSRLPRTARTPIAEYVKALFELVTSPLVKEEPLLSGTAILAFTSLLRDSQVNRRSLHNRYPVHTFGRLISKHDQTIEQEYIPYFARELKNAIKDGDSRRIQINILALGNMGHPKMLAIFEPYLEGKEPVSTFQRTLMVASMSKLADLSPKLARSVLYKIYLNTMEAHEVRCMAVFLLMKTNPPMNMMQRMAEFTNYDTNKHVNSAVKSTIESIAELNRPEYLEMAKKARVVRNYLNPREHGYQYSRSVIIDSDGGKESLAYRLILSYIGSDDSIIPRHWYIGLDSIFGDYRAPTIEGIGLISSVKDLLDMYLSKPETADQSGRSEAENIAKILNIMPDEPSKLEGNIMWNTKETNSFMPFDAKSLERIPDLAMKYLETLKKDRFVNINKMTSYDLTMSFPTETGLPFVYSFKTPTLMKITGTGKVHLDQDHSFKGKAELRMVFSKKIQGRIGFITPFEHQHFVAGVDTSFQVYAPINLEADVMVPKKSIEIKLWSIKGEKNPLLFHYSVVPFTAKHDILNLHPLRSDKNTHNVITGELRSLKEIVPSKMVKALRWDIEADNLDENTFQPNIEGGHGHLLLFPWLQEDDKYRKMDVFMEYQQENPVILKASYDSMRVKPGSVNPQDWKSTAKAVEATDKKPESDERKKQFLMEAAKGIKLANAEVVDVRLETPGEYEVNNGITLAWARSNVEDKARALLYWQFDMPHQDIKNEICVATQALATPEAVMDFEKIMSTKPKVDMDVDIRYGKTCSGDGKINIRGKATQSPELKDKIRDSRVVRDCQEEMKQGNKGLRSCQRAIAAAMTLDDIDLSMDLHSKPIQVLANRVIDIAKNMNTENVIIDASNPMNAGKEKIDIKVKLSEDLEKAGITVHTSAMDMTFPNLDISQLGVENDRMRLNRDGMDSRTIFDEEDQSTCMVDSNRVETFDEKAYPIKLGKCWHVIMTTYPKENPENRNEKLRIPEDRRVSILAREIDAEQKEVKIALDQIEVRLIPGVKPEVFISEREIPVTREKTHQEMQGSTMILEIARLLDESILLTSEKYGISAMYDGKRVMIKASDRYRDSVRGLCGDFDGEFVNDFTSPRNCIMRRPEDFIATYAMIKEDCEGPSMENAKKINEIECLRKKIRLSNVISDRESGRLMGENRNWGYHHGERQDSKQCSVYRTQVQIIDEKICFTIRPVPSCAAACHATETKMKNYQLHCMDKNEASLELMKRVEKGANPDLSQKSVSRTQHINVPLGCIA